MEPVVAPFVTEIRLTLSDLVCVVGERVVDTAAVDIEVFAVVFLAYASALNVPAGITQAPWAFPFKLLRIEL